jgi:hypothetical protein
LFSVNVLIKHVQDAALVLGFRLVVGRIGLAVAGATSGHFIRYMKCYLFRRIKLLSSLKT